GSQFALIALINFLESRGYLLVDCQMTTQHLLRFGATEIDGNSFCRYLQRGISSISPQIWENS
ncbi:MAG: leucyl/phenylalanyl-tRNA--protein transferase, partial [Desulfobacterales bacterium]